MNQAQSHYSRESLSVAQPGTQKSYSLTLRCYRSQRRNSRSVVVSEGFDFIQWLTGISWDHPLPTELSEQRQFWKEQL
ncbi:hypothetical protein T4A_11642 [Trichinella pseudospiralis]|uniref:Uncharacterized protein n=1 Tax=Trichinella pseudospiralis TaxID=6337 RepID=A0A0V1E3E0_TRIPS|nr:hypothetical protein T4A_11642 [Trichinella pseudospiralis]